MSDTSRNDDDYERVITAVQTGATLTPHQKDLARSLNNEAGSRGNRYRDAVR